MITKEQFIAQAAERSGRCLAEGVRELALTTTPPYWPGSIAEVQPLAGPDCLAETLPRRDRTPMPRQPIPDWLRTKAVRAREGADFRKHPCQ